MTFQDIAIGSSVFVDANVFVYHFMKEATFGGACSDLLERIEQGELSAWTSPSVLAECVHRMMTVEAAGVFGWSHQGIVQKLTSQPGKLQQLIAFQQATSDIIATGIHFAVVTETHVVQATDVSRQYGLLTNDALAAVLMRELGVLNLASNDSDFDRVPWITRFSPV